ncbi:MAG: transglycosylase SLT domain-containing protein [Candidatus Baltobacteraceae bacterium]
MSTFLAGVAFAPQITAAARAHGLDPRLLAAVAAQETGGPGRDSGRNTVGDGGHGRGLFQIDDRFHDFARSAAAMNPTDNAEYAAGMLSGLLRRYGGNVHEALSAYNAGDPHASGSVTRWQDGKCLGYADSVLRHYADLGGPSGSLSDELQAEAPSASAALNALMQMAGQSSPAPVGAIPDVRSWRSMAGVGANGASDAASGLDGLVDPLAGRDSDANTV